MKDTQSLNKIIYNILKIQIKFGVYRFGEHLPAMEEMAETLAVSLDTIRLAYHQLQVDGYITLSKRIGSVVKIKYDEKDIDRFIQNYFSERVDAMFDLCRSLPLLLCDIQVFSWKKISLKELDKIERDISQSQFAPAFCVKFYMNTIYGALKNELLMSLLRQFMPICGLAFFDLIEYKKYIYEEFSTLSAKIELRRQENWTALRTVIEGGLERHLSSINYLYQTRITVPAAKEQVVFTWSSHKKASQICYSVSLNILTSIIREYYPVWSFLPSPKILAKENRISVSTIRHSLALLNDLGIVKIINGVGTQILPMDQIGENCNLSNQIVRKRLLDYKQSLQLFVLTCREIAALTISSMDAASKKKWIEQLDLCEHLGRLALIAPFSLRIISETAPYQTIRTVYAELYKQLYWGIPLRGMITQESINNTYRPYYKSMVEYLKNSDATGFAVKLEEVLNIQAEVATGLLAEIGIRDDVS